MNAMADHPLRVPPLAPEERDERTAELLEGLGELNIFATLARHPGCSSGGRPSAACCSTAASCRPGSGSCSSSAPATTAAPTTSGASTCASARQAGLTDDEIAASPRPRRRGWSTDDAELLRAADELHADTRISDATWAALGDALGRAAAHRGVHGRRPVPPGGLHAERARRASPRPGFAALPAR